MKRKGSAVDTIVFATIATTIIISLIIYVRVSVSIFTPLQAEANEILGYNDTQVAAAITNTNSALTLLLASTPFISVIFGLLAIALATQIQTNKAFLPFAIIMWLVGTIAGFLSSHILWEFINVPEILEIVNSQTLLVNFIKYLGFITSVFGALIIIALYAKSNAEGGGSGGF